MKAKRSDEQDARDEQDVRILRPIHRRLKAFVAERGGKIGEVATEIIEAYLKRMDAAKARAAVRKASKGDG